MVFIMNLLIYILSIFFIPADTEVILKPYTTNQCPIVPFEAEQAQRVGERWVVMGTKVINTGGKEYRILVLQSRFPSEYPGLEWPEFAVNLAPVISPY